MLFLSIFSALSLTVTHVRSESKGIHRDNVGTVLFSKSDNLKTCWNDADIALLTSRMLFEDILPLDTVFDIENDHFIAALVEYFQLVVSTVSRSAQGAAKHVLLLSLCDCLGENP